MKLKQLISAGVIGLLVSASAHSAVRSEEKAMINAIDKNKANAIKLLEKSVSINSGTMNFAGVKAVAEHLLPEFKALGFTAQFVDGSAFKRAGHLVATIEGGSGPKMLLIGHLDTVFEPDSPFQRVTYIDKNTMSGPGVSDMKGGNIIMLEALRALASIGVLKKMNIKVVLTGDEELSGRPLNLSKASLIEAAKWADIALGFENGDGNPKTVNTSRRGSVDWTLTVTGVSSHSSQVFKPNIGAGAIYETSRILNQFYEELRSEPMLTFNPGRMLGGTDVKHDRAGNQGTAFGKNNVVAEHAVVTGDIRAISQEQLTRVQQKMQTIVSRNLPKTSAVIQFGEGYPAMAPTEGNMKLLKMYSAVSVDLGQGEVTSVDPINAGAADVSFAADHVDMALDGLGMSGSGNHTVKEVAVLPALPLQAKKAAILMYRLYKP
ncbi:M20 family metallopeptidase [Aestuariibacter sp. GS-14]|uniref:M20/M25/M40 family metallo-hydrolase n=1 Tax=Alteromonadaceae TaxID=72275 RepID=UPI001128D97E|nr:M20/M25/M40 family metallo-hydrolase [Aestuariibacter sp. GS-14]TPV52919.1 M20 family metallopeptidase [Aestuariibacter sp. GS-14]